MWSLPIAEPPVLALVGATGAGKSGIALAAARELSAEIIAVDAFTVYRGMDIGTAKPGTDERAQAPHHMVDVLDPAQECTVQWFQTAARQCIAEVLARGRTPVLVGGAGLYFRAVVDPLEFPPTDAAVRARLMARYAAEPASAHAALARIDPDAAGRIEPGNVRRAVRALEVHEITGRRFSEFGRAWDAWESIYPGLRVIGADVPRAELVARIDARVDAMMATGLLEECRRLAAGRDAAASGGLSQTARQAIGYAELLDHLDGRLPLDEAVQRIKTRTRQYAARQLRWFRRDPRVRWTAVRSAASTLVALGRRPAEIGDD